MMLASGINAADRRIRRVYGMPLPRTGRPTIPATCFVLTLLAAVLTLAAGGAETSASRRTNVVFILTDNQAAWTLGCYGNRDIRTPNIDRLAREGTLFTRCFSSNAVCSPTRATYLTGLLPSQHGIHSYLRAGGAQMGPDAHCTIAEFRSLPQILSEADYVCGLSGKWHLGGNLTPQIGFTDWVTMPHGHTTTFYGAEVIEAGKVRQEPGYLTDFWTDHGVRFIERNKERPFFLFLAYNGPYGLGANTLQPARNRHAATYADQEMKSFPRAQVHPWLRGNKPLLNNVDAMRRYAAEVSGVDDGVGRVLDVLHKNGLDDRTLVVYAADQGLCGGQHGIWGMGDHTRPLSAFDEMMHVPLIWRQPEVVRAGQRSDLLVSNYDFLPTVLEYLGLADKTPAEPSLPGHSYAGALRGKPIEWGDAVFFEFENVRAVRTATWKYIQRFPQGPDELYDLATDPSEATNLIGREAHAPIQQQLTRRLNEFFDRYADPKYDLKRRGTSKTPLHAQTARDQ
jgi:arylsulfatase A-like enzyme